MLSLGDIASEKMEQWESLDLDEAKLQSFMRRCSGSTSLIPGLAGNYQVVIMNRVAGRQESTQQFMGHIVVATFARDFESNAWKWVTMFIKHHNNFLLKHYYNLVISFIIQKI